MSKFVEGFEKQALKINLIPKSPIPKVRPFEGLRQKAMSTGNIVRMNAGKTIVGVAAVGGVGYKAMDWASGNEQTRPDW